MSKEFLARQRVVGIVKKKENDKYEVEPGRVKVERHPDGKVRVVGIVVNGVGVWSPNPDFQLSLGGEFDDVLEQAADKKTWKGGDRDG